MKLTSFSAPQRPIRTVLRQFTDWGRLLRIIFFFSFFSPFLHSGAVLSCVCWLSATTTTNGGKRKASSERARDDGGKEWNGRRREMRCEAIETTKKNYTAQPSSEYVAFVRFGKFPSPLSAVWMENLSENASCKHIKNCKRRMMMLSCTIVDVYRVMPGLSGDSGRSLWSEETDKFSSLTKKKLWFINYKCIGYLHYARSPPNHVLKCRKLMFLARKKL